ncbi:MAG: DUF3368 domain-containing protein [Nanoarchaeota archaeon]
MKAISDSTPLIHLSKIGCINFLKDLFEEIIIPEEVYNEIIVKGKEQGKNEVFLIENLIEEEFIKIRETNSTMEVTNLDKGEKECILLCKELRINNLLIDEKKGFSIANMFNITPIRTTSILLILLDKNIINFNKYKELLRKLSESGYFLDIKTYEKLLSIGENINK